MIINIHNTSNESINIYFCNINRLYVIESLGLQTFDIDDEIIQFDVSSNTNSKFAKLFKRNELQVLSKYFLLNNFNRVDITIEKQEVEDSSYNKFIRFACQDDMMFTKVKYSIKDNKDVKKKEQKSNLLYYIMLFLSHIFSKVNVVFIAIGIAIGGYFGTRYGVLCYLTILALYFIVICLIEFYNDKHLAVDRLMTHDYIDTLFSNNIT